MHNVDASKNCINLICASNIVRAILDTYIGLHMQPTCQTSYLIRRDTFLFYHSGPLQCPPNIPQWCQKQKWQSSEAPKQTQP